MASLLPIRPHTLFLQRARPSRSLRHRFGGEGSNLWLGKEGGQLRRGGVVMSGFRPSEFVFSADGVEGLKEVLRRAESLVYTLADTAVSSSDAVVGGGGEGAKQSSDWLSGITYYMESVLKVLKDGLSALHVPYSYGFAIILLTVLVKAATFPLTKKQVESAMAMRSLAPQIKAIQERYAGDQERIQLETARLYKLANINPLAGCLPTLATIPVWIGLYRALSNVANEGLLTEGFFWIPSLAGPTTIAARQNGSGISWLFPFVDGHPPLGWSDTFAYLVLPVLLVASQYLSLQIMQSSQSNDPNMKTSQAITKFLPLMIGYFALSVPSGLSLYWLTNNILSTAQQVWLQKLGGAQNPISKLNEEQLQMSKPTLEPKAKIEATRQETKSVSTGQKPGERFRLLKEEEARRKRQREDAKKKAREAEISGAQSGASTINGNGSGQEPTEPQNEATTSGIESSEVQVEPDESQKQQNNDHVNKGAAGVLNGALSADKEATSTSQKNNERR
uniref:Membrane insertase YidC/Oxa/ALB C-terminal domain-containing protein n=1 Tax=Kalanchoe fedtschenkoi TaxID=63787 RepID=A0A7N0T9L6_KALFE